MRGSYLYSHCKGLARIVHAMAFTILGFMSVYVCGKNQSLTQKNIRFCHAISPPLSRPMNALTCMRTCDEPKQRLRNEASFKLLYIFVPRGRAPFGQRQESGRSSEIPVLTGFVNTIE